MTEKEMERHISIRLAMRVEGDWWVCYLAKEGTMEGSIELGRIRLLYVQLNPAHKENFMSLMKSILDDFLKNLFDVENTTWTQRTAAEHERSGRG